MAQDIIVSVDTEQTGFVTVDTHRVSEVAAIGIQGLSGLITNLEDFSNIDKTNLGDGSVLVYNDSNSKWIATRILEKQDITGGQY
jgi:DNA polymerase III epsilon subunit-like protein